MKRVADVPMTHPQTKDDMLKVKLYHPFEWQGKMLRVVPVIPYGKHDNPYPCRSCSFADFRNAMNVCPYMKTCCAHLREDNTSVKYIGISLALLNSDEIGLKIAEEADKDLCI